MKARRSCVDDVPTAQPALALTQKIFERVTAGGLPADLIPEGLAIIGQMHDGDAESVLRSLTMEFMDTVREVEQKVLAGRRGSAGLAELDAAPLGVVTEQEWRAHWPTLEEWNRDDAAANEAAEDVAGQPAQDSSVEPQ